MLGICMLSCVPLSTFLHSMLLLNSLEQVPYASLASVSLLTKHKCHIMILIFPTPPQCVMVIEKIIKQLTMHYE